MSILCVPVAPVDPVSTGVVVESTLPLLSSETLGTSLPDKEGKAGSSPPAP